MRIPQAIHRSCTHEAIAQYEWHRPEKVPRKSVDTAYGARARYAACVYEASNRPEVVAHWHT
jgi:hypothetical protein